LEQDVAEHNIGKRNSASLKYVVLCNANSRAKNFDL